MREICQITKNDTNAKFFRPALECPMITSVLSIVVHKLLQCNYLK